MSTVHFILGANGSIGRATARRLSASGAELYLAARDEGRLADLAAELGAKTMPLGDGTMEEIGVAIADAAKDAGRLDGLVNCAGSLLLKPAHLTSDEDWRATLGANLDTAFAAVRAGTKAMLKTGGSIVLITSAAARVGLGNHEAIAAAKAGVQGLALSAAASYAGRGIRVNVVAPGLVRTDMTAKLLSAPANEQASVAMHALGRIGEPTEVASAIAWLLDPEQSWVTGQTLGVDGGLARVRPR